MTTRDDVRAAALDYIDDGYDVVAVNIAPDPMVGGFWAVRIETLQHGNIDLMVDDNLNVDEVKFDSWPPRVKGGSV